MAPPTRGWFQSLELLCGTKVGGGIGARLDAVALPGLQAPVQASSGLAGFLRFRGEALPLPPQSERSPNGPLLLLRATRAAKKADRR